MLKSSSAMDEEIFETTYQKDLNGSFETLSSNSSNKKIRKRISLEQKEVMANYIIENPEMITHSSTKENENELWNELQIKLNKLKPEKSLDCWKSFWNRWRTNLAMKPESNLKLIDCKLKNFLNKLMSNSTEPVQPIKVESSVKKRVTIDEINKSIKDVEKEKSNLTLEVDSNDIKILKYKSAITALENENNEKRKRIQKLYTKKIYLNQKKRKYEEKKENSEQLNKNNIATDLFLDLLTQ